MDAKKKTYLSSFEFPELSFLDKAITFVKMLYPNQGDAITTFCDFLLSLTDAQLLDIISNAPMFTQIIVHYFCSRLHVSNISHFKATPYNLPISITRSENSYIIFFDAVHVCRLIINSYKLYCLYEGAKLKVDHNADNNESKIIDVQYEFLLTQHEAKHSFQPPETITAQSQVDSSRDDDLFKPLRNITCGLFRHLPELSKSSALSSSSPLSSSLLEPEAAAELRSMHIRKTPLESIYNVIKERPSTFVVLTLILQVLESFQVIDKSIVDKSVDIYMSRIGKTYAKTKINKLSKATNVQHILDETVRCNRSRTIDTLSSLPLEPVDVGKSLERYLPVALSRNLGQQFQQQQQFYQQQLHQQQLYQKQQQQQQQQEQQQYPQQQPYFKQSVRSETSEQQQQQQQLDQTYTLNRPNEELNLYNITHPSQLQENNSIQQDLMEY